MKCYHKYIIYFQEYYLPDLKLLGFKEKKEINTNWKSREDLSKCSKFRMKTPLLQYKMNALILKHRLITLWTNRNVICLECGGFSANLLLTYRLSFSDRLNKLFIDVFFSMCLHSTSLSLHSRHMEELIDWLFWRGHCHVRFHFRVDLKQFLCWNALCICSYSSALVFRNADKQASCMNKRQTTLYRLAVLIINLSIT